MLERLLLQIPGDAAGQSALAQVQLRGQDVAALERTAERVLVTRPESALGYYREGRELQARGELEPSITQFKTALSKAPEA